MVSIDGPGDRKGTGGAERDRIARSEPQIHRCPRWQGLELSDIGTMESQNYGITEEAFRTTPIATPKLAPLNREHPPLV